VGGNRHNLNNYWPVRLADGWCWFVLRKKYYRLVVIDWFVLREKYCWLVADKPNEQGVHNSIMLCQVSAITCIVTL
jgi:hypothetical protein